MNWQPIETAPEGKPLIGFWIGSPVNFENYAITFFHPDAGEWVCAEDEEKTYRRPDYWMPLPEPPK